MLWSECTEQYECCGEALELCRTKSFIGWKLFYLITHNMYESLYNDVI